MFENSIKVKTDQFDGPLGLLLLLIQKEEMDIKKLDITLITKQYLNYLDQMKDLNFDVAGEYLFLASSLLLLKSKECLNEEDLSKLSDSPDELVFTSQAELINRLEELQRFQRLGQKLLTLPRLGEDIFKRPKVNRKAIVNSILTPMDLQKLIETYLDFIQKNNRKYTVIKRDRLSIKEKLIFLKEFLDIGSKSNYFDLIAQDGGEVLSNKIITFISLLELARLGKIDVYQNEQLSNIYVEVKSSLENFNVELADGFEVEGEGNTDSEEVSAPIESEKLETETLSEDFLEVSAIENELNNIDETNSLVQ